MKFPIVLAAAIATSGCVTTTANMEGDALPSAEMLAFQRLDARLNWNDARIEWDANECAVYRGTDPQGRTQDRALTREDGQPICWRGDRARR